MLDTQYRMHPRISDFASQTMYGGLLRSAEDMEKNRQNVAAQNPAAGYAIAFADLSGMMSVCTKTGDNSRVNVLSALMSFSLALEAAKTQEAVSYTHLSSEAERPDLRSAQTVRH